MKYKAIDTVDGMLAHAKELGMKAKPISSQSITGNGSFTTEDIFAYYPWTRDSKDLIPGLRCPDCDAQAFKTDHPEVASCSSTRGWFFFYKKIGNKKEKKKTIKLINGEYQEVEEEEKTLA